MSSRVETLVYVLASEQWNALRAIVGARAPLGDPVLLEAVTGDAAPVVRQALLHAKGRPVGVVASNESQALEALDAGADEAAVFDVVAEPGFLAFLDRLRLRARQRRERERWSRDVVQAEKLTELGTLLAGVGHELNNPLAAMTLLLDFAGEHVVPRLDSLASEASVVGAGVRMSHDLREVAKDLRRILRDARSSSASVAQLVQDLRVFSRHTQVEAPAPQDVAGIVEQALRLVARELPSTAIVERDYGDDLPSVFVPRNRLAQVLTNLLINAAHAVGEVERDTHRIRVSARVDEQFMAVSVTDTGPGIPPDDLDRIFDPFFTTKREGLGTGLGLSISLSLLRDMGGDLLASSVSGEGATFVCLVPLASAGAVDVSSATPYAGPLLVGATPYSVLVVDDDARVLRAIARVLGEHYKILVAANGQEAIELLSTGSHADVVVADVDMPEVDGLQLHAWLAEHHPELAPRTIFVTGAGERAAFRKALDDSSVPVLHKPFQREELLRAVQAVLRAGVRRATNGLKA